ncbi:MAG: HepT-like ribonuclease domain-containing protein [Cyanobacteria bacterium J06621_11]
MLRDDASLLDIYQAGQNVINFSEGLERKDLEIHEMRTSSILFQIMIIGEATKRLSSEFRAQHPELPWSDMAGMRDVLAHQYDRLDFNLMWKVMHKSVPEMLKR